MGLSNSCYEASRIAARNQHELNLNFTGGLKLVRLIAFDGSLWSGSFCTRELGLSQSM